MNREYILKNGQLLTVRLARKEDAEELLRYLEKVGGESNFLTFGENEIKTTVVEEENYICYMNDSNNRLFLIAEVDRKIAGSLSFTAGAKSRVFHTGEFGITVLKEYWGLGIGKILIKSLIDWAIQGKVIRKINLRAREDNMRALNLYKDMGFHQEGIITRDSYIDGRFFNSILMGLEID
jgi:RimJ/RimL family protein N-acetyltransferase